LETSNKKSIANQIWLNYYNSYLYDKGVITETERNKMKNLISTNCHAPAKKKQGQEIGR